MKTIIVQHSVIVISATSVKMVEVPDFITGIDIAKLKQSTGNATGAGKNSKTDEGISQNIDATSSRRKKSFLSVLLVIW